MIDSKNVPTDVLARANCVIVLPDVKKFGFGIGGSGGRGPMICRQGKNFSGRWSTPAMYTIGGASFGLQVGGSSTDFVLLIMSQKGVDAVLKGKTKLGNEATAAAGPSGVAHAGTVGGTDILTYADASGLFAGTSLGAATLEPDSDANQRLYDKALTAQEIMTGNAVKPTQHRQAVDFAAQYKGRKAPQFIGRNEGVRGAQDANIPNDLSSNREDKRSCHGNLFCTCSRNLSRPKNRTLLIGAMKARRIQNTGGRSIRRSPLARWATTSLPSISATPRSPPYLSSNSITRPFPSVSSTTATPSSSLRTGQYTHRRQQDLFPQTISFPPSQ